MITSYELYLVRRALTLYFGKQSLGKPKTLLGHKFYVYFRNGIKLLFHSIPLSLHKKNNDAPQRYSL